MTTFISQFMNWMLNKNERDREEKTFYLKSLLFLILIVIFLSNKQWNMVDNVERLLGENIMQYILIITKVGLHFYTALAYLAFIIMFISSIVYIFMDKLSPNSELVKYMNGIRVGSEFRFTWSIEDIVLCLMIAYLFDKEIIFEYMYTYSEFLWIIVFIIGFLVFIFTSLKGVINRFFVLWGISDNGNKK